MTENRKAHVIVLRVAAVLLILVMLSTSMVAGRYARYVSSADAEDKAHVAAFVFDVNDTVGHYINLTNIRKPGDSAIYQFSITNHNGKTSEVSESYSLIMELRGSLPLICNLAGGDNIVLDGKNTGVASQAGSQHTLAASVESNVDYVLTVTWPEEENDIEYSRAGLSELVLTILAQQVD